MKATRELREWVRRLVKRFGKKNGRVPSFAFDNPWMERKDANTKRSDKHVKEYQDWRAR